MLVGLIGGRSVTIKILSGRILLGADAQPLLREPNKSAWKLRPISVNMSKITATFALGAFMKPRRMCRCPIAELLCAERAAAARFAKNSDETGPRLSCDKGV